MWNWKYKQMSNVGINHEAYRMKTYCVWILSYTHYFKRSNLALVYRMGWLSIGEWWSQPKGRPWKDKFSLGHHLGGPHKK